LLQALRDVNVPKFLSADLVLFENIILDLFPGVDVPKVDRPLLLNAITMSLKKFFLQPHDLFIKKVL